MSERSRRVTGALSAQAAPKHQGLALSTATGTKFEKGDSNRCRNAYEKVLHAQLPSSVLARHKKNKHISVGRCRHLAIVHGVALPPYKLLQAARWELADVRGAQPR